MCERNSPPPPNIFGVFRHTIRFSPFNGSTGILRTISSLFTLFIFLSMLFRIYWLFYRTNATILSFGWAERNVYAFLTFESISCVIGIFIITKFGKIELFEQRIAQFQSLRLRQHNDNHQKLHAKLLVSLLLNFAAFGCASTYLVCNKMTIYGDPTNYTNWYSIFDTTISFFCAYVNFLYLPIFYLIQRAIQQEFDILNNELRNDLRDSKFHEIAQQYSSRHQKLIEFSSLINSRIGVFITYSTLNIFTAMVNNLYIISNFAETTSLLYFGCLIAIFVSLSSISGLIMVPCAQLEDSINKTLKILLNDGEFQESDKMFRIFRLMSDRIKYGRHTVHASFLCRITTKNLKMIYFIISNIVLLLTILSKILIRE